jgi:broad-specificity NMP kinase
MLLKIAVYRESHMEHKYTVWAECRDFIYKNSVRTSQETHYVSTTEPNRLMLFREIIAVYCESHVKHTNTLRGQIAEASVRYPGEELLST